MALTALYWRYGVGLVCPPSGSPPLPGLATLGFNYVSTASWSNGMPSPAARGLSGCRPCPYSVRFNSDIRFHYCFGAALAALTLCLNLGAAAWAGSGGAGPDEVAAAPWGSTCAGQVLVFVSPRSARP